MNSQALVQVVTPSRPSLSFDGFSQIRDYVERFTAAVAIRRSDNLADVLDPARAMDLVYMAAERRTPNPAYHFVLSWRDQNIEHEYVWAAVRQCLDSVKMAEHQWLAAIHGDTAHTHAHVLVNRVHPQTHRYWRSGGRDHQTLMRAVGATRSSRPDDYITPGAKTVEIQSGQQSYQRWLRLNVAPVVNTMLDDHASWNAIQERLGHDLGVQFARVDGDLKVVDDHPSRRRLGARVHKPLAMHATALKSPHDLDAIERAANNELETLIKIRHERGYVAAFAAYALRTEQVNDPVLAPLYDRYIAERDDWYASGIEDARKQRTLIALSRDARIAMMRRDHEAEISRFLETSSHEDVRFYKNIASHFYTHVHRERIRDVRDEARAQINEVMLRFPPHIFRRWLGRIAAAGDLDARDAIAYIRTGKSPSIKSAMEQKAQGYFASEQRVIEAPSTLLDRSNAVTENSIAQQVDGKDDNGIRRGPAERATRVQSIADAIEEFGDRDEVERLVFAYREYLATFVTSDPSQQTISQLDLAEKRRRAIDEWARAERKAIDKEPNGSRSREHALHLGRRLRNEAAYQQTMTVEQSVIANLTDQSKKKTLNAFLHDLGEPQATRLAQLLPPDLSFAYPTFEPRSIRDRRFLQELEATQVGQDVRFTMAGAPAFDDRGDLVIAHERSSPSGDRAALEYAVIKFGQPIELTGDRAYTTRMLALAVEMDIPISNAELATEQSTLIEQQRKCTHEPEPIPARQQSELAKAYAYIATDVTLSHDERSKQLDGVFLDALKRQLLVTRPTLRTTSDGAAGRVQNVHVFGNRAFAVVRNDEGEHLFRVPRSMARELAVAIGGDARPHSRAADRTRA